jgi:hypothetical protein
MKHERCIYLAIESYKKSNVRRLELVPKCLRSLTCNVLLAASFSFALQANEEHLKYETETDRYELVFNDQRISVEDMRKVAWLSPYIPPDIPSPFSWSAASTWKELWSAGRN